jgi:hypothetical protein
MDPLHQNTPEGKPDLTEEQLNNVRAKAITIGYEELNELNQAQQKVTEEELETRATAAVVAAGIAQQPTLYGEAGAAVQCFLEAYRRVWREGGAVVSSLLERAAVVQAQEDKREDMKRSWVDTNDSLRVSIQAQMAALRHVVGKQLAAEFASGIFSTEEKEPAPFLTETQRAAIKLYIDTYSKAYQLYQPPQSLKSKRFFGLF